MSEYDDMLNSFEKRAKFNLERDGYCNPVAFLIKKVESVTEINLVPLIFHDDDEKRQVKECLKGLVIVLDIDRYFIIMETWVSHNVHASSARKDPYKREALTITEFIKNTPYEKSVTNFFHKEGDKIVWEERTVDKDRGSTWNFYMEDISKDLLEMKEKERRERVANIIRQEDFEKEFNTIVKILESKFGEKCPYTYEEFKKTMVEKALEGKLGLTTTVSSEIAFDGLRIKEKKNVKR